MISIAGLALFLQISFALANDGRFVILDTGVGHRSTPVPRWRTSLRSLDGFGTNASTLQQFGPLSSPGSPAEPIGAYSLAYSPSTQSLFHATGSGIIRTDTSGAGAAVVVPFKRPGRYAQSVTVAEASQKLYFGTWFDGLIWRANYDGSGAEVFRNVSQGIQEPDTPFNYSTSSAKGIYVDEKQGWVYWSALNGAEDGSIRRVPLDSKRGDDEEDGKEEEILFEKLLVPAQLRMANGYLYWVEQGRWSSSPTAIKRAKIPASKTALTAPLISEVVVSSSQNDLFSARDYTGAPTMLAIQSFTFDAAVKKMWFVVQSSGRTMFGKLVESGASGGTLKVLNNNTADIGVPIGVEYLP